MLTKFKKVFYLEGLFASVAAIGYTTRHGEELTDELKEDLTMLVERVKERLQGMESVTHHRFDSLVTTIVEEYATQVEHTYGAKKMLMILLKEKWHEIEAERFTSSPRLSRDIPQANSPQVKQPRRPKTKR